MTSPAPTPSAPAMLPASPSKRSIWKERPVMTGATVTALLTAIYTGLDAFEVWNFTEAQRVAVGGLIAAVALCFGKSAASNVFVPSTVETIVASTNAEKDVAVTQRDEANSLAHEAMAVAAQAHNRPVAVGNRVPLPPNGGPLPPLQGPPPPINPVGPAGPVGGRDPNSQGNN